MKRRLILLAVAGLLLGLPGVAAALSDAAAEQVVAELRQIRMGLERAAENLAEAKGPSKAGDGATKISDWRRDMEAMPVNTRDDVLAYVRAVLQPEADIQERLRHNNLFAPLLGRVPDEYFDAVYEAICSNQKDENLYAMGFLADFVRPEHKDLVLNLLPTCSALLDAALAQGWIEEAKQIFLDKVAAQQWDMPITWVYYLKEFEDPSLYPAFRDIFIHSENPFWIYDMIEDLPIDDLGGAAYQAWQRQAADETREDEVFDPCRFSGKATAAAMAAGFGHKDALDAFIKEWDAVMQDPDRRVEAKVFRTQARKLLPILGSLDNLPEWYAEHRDALVYDSNAKTYTLPGD